HQLPALRFRKFRPDRHILSNHSIGQQPEKSSGRCVLDFRSAKARRLARAFGGFAMAFCAVLFKQNGAGGNSVWIVLQWIGALPCFLGCLLQFGVDDWIVLWSFAVGWFVLRQHNGNGKKQSADGQRRSRGFHLRPAKSRLTIEPKPLISRDTPQRMRN